MLKKYMQFISYIKHQIYKYLIILISNKRSFFTYGTWTIKNRTYISMEFCFYMRYICIIFSTMSALSMACLCQLFRERLSNCNVYHFDRHFCQFVKMCYEWEILLYFLTESSLSVNQNL